MSYWEGFMIGWVVAGLFSCAMFYLMTRPLCKKWDNMVRYIDNINKRISKIWLAWQNENSGFYSNNYLKLDKLKNKLVVDSVPSEQKEKD